MSAGVQLLLLALLALLLAVLLSSCIAGSVLSAPARSEVGRPPAGLAAQTLLMPTDAGDQVAGWFAPGVPGTGAVLLLHGVRGDRRDMLARASFLHAQGFALMLIDLPAHGQSSGEQITYGLRESAGVRAALAELRRRAPAERIGVIGVSLGAASLVLAQPQPALDAIVLEAMFPSFDEAVANRMALHLGDWARPLASLLLVQMPWRLGVTKDELRPIDRIGRLQAPLLLVAGDQDRHTRLEESERLFAAALAPKQLWLVKGAAHVDLHAFGPAAYEARIGGFLAENLHRVTAGLPLK